MGSSRTLSKAYSSIFVTLGDRYYQKSIAVDYVPDYIFPHLAELRLLSDLQPGHVVTLCGPGGIGKTALAAEAIWRLAPGNEPPKSFPDGIIFHTFYHQPQAVIALEAITRAYGGDPRPSPLEAEAARRSLAGRQALIVLDGTEDADDLEAVLSVTGSCGVLITARRHSDAPADFNDLPPLTLDGAVESLQVWGGELAKVS